MKKGQKDEHSTNNILSRRCFSQWKYNAKRRGIEWNISLEYLRDLFIKQDGKCALTHEPLICVQNHSLDYILQTASLDRIDSKKGYLEGNVRFVTKKINMIKGVLTDLELLDLCKRIITIFNYTELINTYSN